MSRRPPARILAEIAAACRRRFGVPAERIGWPPPEARARPLLAAENEFLAALTRARGRALIAEVKLGSPRLGSLVGRVDPERQAEAYARAGAAAISVVVEPEYFHGNHVLLTRARDASGLPAVAKDFVVSARQIELAAEAGASAVLLLASLLEREELFAFAGYARSLGLAPLVETHLAEEIAELAGSAWELVGVNSRDLETFAVDLEPTVRLAELLPPEALRVAESGIAGAADVARLREAGYDAFLVGEALLLADDLDAKLHELLA